MIRLTTPTGHAVLINPTAIERVRVADSQSPSEAHASIDLQSGKTEHVRETLEAIENMLPPA